MFSLGEIIDLAIQVEKNGEKSYRRAQKEVKNRDLASVLEWLADDEKAHVKWFNDFKKGIDEKIEDPRLEDMGREILASVLGEQSFSMDDADFSRIKDVSALLELSLEFEKDTILFYEMIKAFVDDKKVSAGLDRIIREEKVHVKKLEEMIGKR
jgi:rubrerythrin